MRIARPWGAGTERRGDEVAEQPRTQHEQRKLSTLDRLETLQQKAMCFLRAPAAAGAAQHAKALRPQYR